ncbi:MAG: flagellar assembly protein FliW [Eubacterium sp.]|jgi:flagellar assembly factor FliW|nr:flagellar assembly protein FliW [Eubacterium sp.]
MVKIETRDFGEIEVDPDRIFNFPDGIFAFEDTKQFALISPLGDDVYPMWLQATDSVTPCFIVFDPSLIDQNYRISLSESERKFLQIEDGTNIKLLSLASVPEDYRMTTVNMKSPIVINADKRLATQVILPDKYDFRLPIYQKIQEVGAV